MRMKVKGILDPTDFLAEVEELAADGVEYIDAVVEVATKRGIEIETAAAIIKKSELIKSRIQQEAEDLNILPKTARLPV